MGKVLTEREAELLAGGSVIPNMNDLRAWATNYGETAESNVTDQLVTERKGIYVEGSGVPGSRTTRTGPPDPPPPPASTGMGAGMAVALIGGSVVIGGGLLYWLSTK